MATTLNYEQMLRSIVEQDERKLDLVSDTRNVNVDMLDNRLHLTVDRPGGVAVVKPNEHALGQIATDLGIPRRYFDRMHEAAPELLKRNFDHWLTSEPNRRLIRAFKPGDDGVGAGRAWLSDRYRRLDNIEIGRAHV